MELIVVVYKKLEKFRKKPASLLQMEHFIPDHELDKHEEESTCACQPRIIYDKVSGELVALHYDKDGDCIDDEVALEILHDDDEDDEIMDNFRKHMGL